MFADECGIVWRVGSFEYEFTSSKDGSKPAGLYPNVVSYGAVMKAVDWVRALHLLEQLQVRVVLGTVSTHQSHRYPL